MLKDMLSTMAALSADEQKEAFQIMKAKRGKKPKFTPAQQQIIASEYNSGGYTMRELADKYACSVGLICKTVAP